MPLYEYHCDACARKFTMLRPFSKADAPAPCPACHGEHTQRALSLCASFSRNADGSSQAISGGGGGGCASCSSGNCGHCGHHH
jgi:putative FmdB family regulatory protein